jgi:hypothetical protein
LRAIPLEPDLRDTADLYYQKLPLPGTLRIQKKISFLYDSQSEQSYDEYWSGMFPGPAVFAITPDSNWSGGENGSPVADDAEHVTEYTLANNEAAPEIDLAPGTYWVFERTARQIRSRLRPRSR